MSAQKKQVGQKVILGALFICIIVLIFFTYLNYRDSEEKISFLENERTLIVNDLELIKSDFDTLAKNNNFYKEEIDRSRQRIARLIDSMSILEVDYTLLHRYRKELIMLRRENKKLHEITDSLNQQNILLAREVDMNKLRIVELTRYTTDLEKENKLLSSVSDSLKNENQSLNDNSGVGHFLRITALEGTAYKIKSNGKMILTNRYSRADRLRACFNIAPTDLLEEGDLVFYLQFIDPDNKILGNETANIKGKSLVFSKRIVVSYDNNPLSVCDAIVSTGLEKSGDYRLNVYYQDKLAATAVFQLK